MKKIYRMEALNSVAPNFNDSEKNPYEFNASDPYFCTHGDWVESLSVELSRFALEEMGYSLVEMEIKAA